MILHDKRIIKSTQISDGQSPKKAFAAKCKKPCHLKNSVCYGENLMSTRSKKGWLRIGIVLSVLWILAFWSYSVVLYRQATPLHGTWLFNQVKDESQPVQQHEDLQLVPVKPQLRILPFAMGTFAPVAAGWLFVILIV